MPAKLSKLSEAERAKRIRETAREHKTDNDPASFERAFAVVARGDHKPKKQGFREKIVRRLGGWTADGGGPLGAPGHATARAWSRQV